MKLEEIDELVGSMLFEMSNIRPKDSGLPMVVWLSFKGKARHDARIKVSKSHGSKIDFNNLVSVTLRPTIRMIPANGLSSDDFHLVVKFIELNSDLILAYWEGEIGTSELMNSLRLIDP